MLLKKEKGVFPIIKLFQSDFDYGTYRIVNSGYYMLVENISFNPNPNYDNPSKGWFPVKNDCRYDNNAYGLGFFAALTIECEDVILDLNGFTLEQHPEHALQQRFYANIELADRPFIPGQGPHNFGSVINSAKKCVIMNGIIGRSSHHGIHGNENHKVIIKDLIINNFEVGGIHLNNCDDLLINNVCIGSNRQDVPVMSYYSACRFIYDFIYQYLDKDVTFRGKSGGYYYKKLEENINNTFNEYKKNYDYKDITNKLFKNETGLIDGSCYGIVVNKKGIAIGGFAKEINDSSDNIVISNIDIKDIKNNVKQIKGIKLDKLQLGVAGEVFDYDLANKDGNYYGNVLSDVHLWLGKVAYKYGLKIGTLNIEKKLIRWAERGCKFIPEFIYNGDSMHHLNKGLVGLRLDGIYKGVVYNFRIKKLLNIASEEYVGENYLDDNFEENDNYGGDNSFGITISKCKKLRLSKGCVKYVQGEDTFDIVVMNGSEDIKFTNVKAKIKNISI